MMGGTLFFEFLSFLCGNQILPLHKQMHFERIIMQ